MALHFRLAALAALALVSGAPQDWTDCSPETDGHLQPRNGTFGPIEFVNASFLGNVPLPCAGARFGRALTPGRYRTEQAPKIGGRLGRWHRVRVDTGKPVYALLPTAADGRSFPLMAFMHGSTGQVRRIACSAKYAAAPGLRAWPHYALFVERCMITSLTQFEMYQQNLYMYATHGFVVVFPFVKGPEADKNP